MKIPKTIISNKNKDINQIKINIEQNDSIFNNNTISPMQNLLNLIILIILQKI